MCVDCCILEKQGLYIGRANMWMCDKSSILIKNCIAFSNHYHIIFNQMNKHIAEISRKYNWGLIHTDFIFMLRCLFKLLNFSRCKVIISLNLKKKGWGFWEKLRSCRMSARKFTYQGVMNGFWWLCGLSAGHYCNLNESWCILFNVSNMKGDGMLKISNIYRGRRKSEV